MALARFYGKSVLSAASLLRDFDEPEFRRALEAVVVGIAFDSQAAESVEGRATLELLMDLLARLYPQIALIDLTGRLSGGSDLRYRLVERALAINPSLEIESTLEAASVLTLVGATNADIRGSASFSNHVIYLGSEGWLARASTQSPLPSGATSNPYGAGAAACIGAAAVFRTVFSEKLPGDESAQSGLLSASASNRDISLSLLDWASVASRRNVDVQPLGRVDIGESFLIGLGAIGNAATWALARTPRLSGRLHLIDEEFVDLSNLQRYVLTTDNSVGEQKVAIALSQLTAERPSSADSELDVQAHPMRWQQYIAQRGDYVLENVLLALDSAEDRIAAQASLPRWIANAWTQPANLGISRHPSFLDEACVACLYLPTQVRKSKDLIYAEALHIQRADEVMEIRRLLHTGEPVGEKFLATIAERLDVPANMLSAYAGKPLENFYTEALCGGIVLELQPKTGIRAEVPMAFQSALAGIGLAAELVVKASELRKAALPSRTEIDLLRPLGTRLNNAATKHPSGRCICQDAAYRSAFARKYGIKESSAAA